jgi:hypothetical protein
MAIAVGDRVRPRLSSTTPALSPTRLTPQPPVLAVVTQLLADLVNAVVAENGITWTINASTVVATGVPATALDQLTPPNTVERDTYIDKVVVGLKQTADPNVPDITVQYSSEYVGVVVDVYRVNGVLSVLIRAINSGMFYELPATRVSIAPNR